MSEKNFVSYGDAEVLMTEIAATIKDKNTQYLTAAGRNTTVNAHMVQAKRSIIGNVNLPILTGSNFSGILANVVFDTTTPEGGYNALTVSNPAVLANIQSAQDPTGANSVNISGAGSAIIGKVAYGRKMLTNGGGSFIQGTAIKRDMMANAPGAHAEGHSTQALAFASHAEGSTTCVGVNAVTSHAEGYATRTLAPNSHVEGKSCWIDSNASGVHAEGYESKVLNTSTFDMPGTHAEGYNTLASNGGHSEGYRTRSTGEWTHSEGVNTISRSKGAHAEGKATIAFGLHSHVEGSSTYTGGYDTHAEGISTLATGQGSHAGGKGSEKYDRNYHYDSYPTMEFMKRCYVEASGMASFAHGYMESNGNDYSKILASGNGSFACGIAIAQGSSTTQDLRTLQATGEGSAAFGLNTQANARGAFAVGRYNSHSTSTSTHLFTVGKGSASGRANAFRVAETAVYGAGAYNSSGADYAEMFEWADGNPNNEDRAGYFVALEGNKISIATDDTPGDYIIGICSGNPSVCGDVYDDQYKDMYLTDIFGRPVYEEYEERVDTGEKDEEGDRIYETRIQKRQVMNPDWDSNQTYIPRSERPEWDAVGLLGKLVVIDDGTANPDDYVAPNKDGIATKTRKNDISKKFRVMERLDANHIRVLILQ